MGPFVHSTKTKEWAIEIGFTDDDAKTIAAANAAVDGNANNVPYIRGRHLNINIREICGGYTSQRWYALRELGLAIQGHDLGALGRGLHSVQDEIAHGAWLIYGTHWKGPWLIRLGKRRIKLRSYDPDRIQDNEMLERLEEASKEYLGIFLKVVRDEN